MRRTIDCLPPGCPRRLSLVVRFSVHGDVDVHPYSHLQSLLALLLGRLLGRPFDWSLSGYLSAIDSVGLERRRALSAQHRRNKSAWLKTSSAGCRRWHGRFSPLRNSTTSGNRGVKPGQANRKRSRAGGEDATPSVAASSPLASSPPAFAMAHGGDDEDDIEDEALIQDDIGDIDKTAEGDADLVRDGYEQDSREWTDDAYEGIGVDDEPRRRRHHYDEDDPDEDMDADIMDEELSLEALQDVKASSLTDWASQPSVHRTIKWEFRAFLAGYINESGASVYGNRIKTLGEVNAKSLEVSHDHLSSNKAILAYFLANSPAEILELFDELRQSHLHCLVRLPVPWPVHLNLEKTVCRNYQKADAPGVPWDGAGRLPRHREFILLWDLIDKAKPGEEIEVMGIYRNNYILFCPIAIEIGEGDSRITGGQLLGGGWDTTRRLCMERRGFACWEILK
ncbi:hypothetical protein B0T25DRAFT_627855 [Lasiosphaeria hispida]|uniref:Uncharacterized protein n=1 Tax=Lasiosphaeria hispida TaxID=260671 RepID=A0AAJ0HVW8_9PEZI|nr:hypothetical protein B0T25DRAFT_627855 [Lasiosphaeria hispida]